MFAVYFAVICRTNAGFSARNTLEKVWPPGSRPAGGSSVLPTPTSREKGERRREGPREWKERKGGKGKVRGQEGRGGEGE